jgi:hypothetical protein
MTATTAVPRAELQDPRAQADAEMPDAGKLLAEQRRIRDNRAVQRVWLAIVLVAIFAVGAGRRCNAAYRFRAFDHRMEADPRCDSAA